MPIAELSFESGEASLSVRSFRVKETISAPFLVSVVALSPNQIDLESLIGRPASFYLETAVAWVNNPGRRWAGVCNHIEQLKAEPTGLSTYEVHLVPTLWLLTQRRGHRIYQHAAIPDILESLLKEWSVEYTFDIDRKSYPKLNYKVQYGETDYVFVSRLLEEAGLAFTFSDSSGTGSSLVIGDALHSKSARVPAFQWVENPNESAEQEFVSEVRLAHEVRPGAYTIRDYDFRRPAYTLQGTADPAAGTEGLYEQYHYRPGAFVTEGATGGDTPVADDQAVVRADETYGKALADRSLAGRRVSRKLVSFRTNVLDIAPGTVLSITNYPHSDLASEQNLLMYELSIDGAIGLEWTVRGTAVFADVPYRPLRGTPKTVVDGVQSAKIVGPSGKEIHTDEFGRVRVQFPWDREGRDDEHSCCWVRVGQGWAGTGYGLINLPRIGQEVLVGFLEGDPDQPVVVGRVFNALNPVPYALPRHQTRSTWKSNSSPGGGGFNEIMLEDLAGAELVYVQAEKDLRKLVKNDETITVGRDRQKLVKGNETETVRGNRTEVTNGSRIELTRKDRTTVIGQKREELVKLDAVERIEGDSVRYIGGDQHLIVKGTKREEVGRDSHLLVKGMRQEQVGSNYCLSAGSHQIACGSMGVGAGGNIFLKAGAKIVIEAPDITVKAPGGFVRLDSTGVTIVGTKVNINSGGGPGVGGGAMGGHPEPPKEAVVAIPQAPVPDDVSKTGLGPGRE